jgi:hypothetical protein
MKIVAKVSCVLAVVAGLFGCEAESPAFIGKWVEQGVTGPTSHTLHISMDQGVYTVIENIPIGGMVRSAYYVAKVESDNALSVKNGFRSLTLTDGVLHYMSKSYVKLPN